MRCLLLAYVLLATVAKISAYSYTIHKRIVGAYVNTIKQNFGLATNGQLIVDYDLVSIDASLVFVLLLSSTQKKDWYDLWLDNSPIKYVSYGCNLPSMGRWQLNGNGSLTFDIRQADQYTLLLLQCSNSSTDVQAQFYMINPSPDGDVEEHLSIDKAMFPTFYAVMVGVYSFLLAGFLFECVLLFSSVQYIHYVFAATCAVKLLYMGLSREKFYHNSRLGYTSEPLVMSQKVFEQVSDSLFLLALLLVSLGWTITRHVLYWREFQLIVATNITYLILAVAGAVQCEENSNSEVCSILQLTVYVFRCLYVLSIIVCMNFTHTHTRAYISDLPWNVEVAVLYARLKQYQTFRWVFLGYLIGPVGVIILNDSVLTWEYKWVAKASTHLADLCVNILIGVTFKPLSTHALLRTFNGANGDTM